MADEVMGLGSDEELSVSTVGLKPKQSHPSENALWRVFITAAPIEGVIRFESDFKTIKRMPKDINTKLLFLYSLVILCDVIFTDSF